MRNLVRASAVKDDTTRAYLQELTAAGAHVRVIEDLSELMLVYDHRTTLVPVDPKNYVQGCPLLERGGDRHHRRQQLRAAVGGSR
ncbi:hypothetical protein [Streptomyces sp. KL116D]|uniref:hypothetical protein n=1 Tax=Streptomyces sp. KL116D TaxID=3045152 RepID=UPI003559090A